MDLRLIKRALIGLWFASGAALFGLGLFLPGTATNATGVVTDVVEYFPSDYVYSYEIEYVHEGEVQRSIGYEGGRFDIGDQLAILVGPDGLDVIDPNVLLEDLRWLGGSVILIGLSFVGLKLLIKHGSDSEPVSSLVDQLVFSSVGVVALLVLFGATSWDSRRFGPTEDVSVVSAVVLGAESGVELTVESDSGTIGVTTIDFREWQERPNEVTVYPETDPLRARTERNGGRHWLVWASVALAVLCWGSIVQKFTEGRKPVSTVELGDIEVDAGDRRS